MGTFRSLSGDNAIAIEVLDQLRSTSMDRLQNLILLAHHCINNPYFASYSSEEAFNDGILIYRVH